MQIYMPYIQITYIIHVWWWSLRLSSSAGWSVAAEWTGTGRAQKTAGKRFGHVWTMNFNVFTVKLKLIRVYYWLVVWNINFIFPLILGCCPHPNWRTPSFFRTGWPWPTNQKRSLGFSIGRWWPGNRGPRGRNPEFADVSQRPGLLVMCSCSSPLAKWIYLCVYVHIYIYTLYYASYILYYI